MVSDTTKYVYQKLFSDPAIILIGSSAHSKVWKTGKTDFFLKLSEDLLDLGLIDEVATNIHTEDHYSYIHDLENLKFWLHRNSKTKLYGLDEANVHLPSRRAMSTKSVEITQLFPEISKGHARLIMIGQQLTGLDSELRGAKDWVKGTIEKMSKKTAIIRSSMFDQAYVLRNIPATTIKFDPFLTAPFTLKATDKQVFKDDDMEKLREWADGKPWRELFPHPQACNRFVRANVKRLLSQYSLFNINRVEGTSQEIVK